MVLKKNKNRKNTHESWKMRHDINLKLKVLLIISQWKKLEAKNFSNWFYKEKTVDTNVFGFSMWEWWHENNAACQNNEQTVHENEEAEPIQGSTSLNDNYTIG